MKLVKDFYAYNEACPSYNFSTCDCDATQGPCAEDYCPILYWINIIKNECEEEVKTDGA